MSKILILMVSKDNNFAIDEFAIQDFYDTQPEYKETVDIQKISNNTMLLPELYNNVLDDVKYKTFVNKEEYDFVVFMHADVSLKLVDLIMHIEKCKDKYDVMGLCGCAKFSVNESPLNWFCGSRQYPESRWGCVTHGETGNQTSYFSQHSPQEMDHSVACIDGLCIIINKKAAEAGLRFDIKMHFNCYDTQISLEAVLVKKLRLGVLVEKSLYHYSVGKSILTDDFLYDELVLRERYNLGIPKNTRIENIWKNVNNNIQIKTYFS